MASTADSRFIIFHTPTDPQILSAVGEVAIRHEHMNHMLRMTIKSLAGITVEAALKATMYAGSAELRTRVKKLARKRLGEGSALLQIEAMMADCERLTKKRNDLVHGLWATEIDGDPHLRDAYGQETKIPTAAELRGLAEELSHQVTLMNRDRLQGFLAEALLSTKAT